MEDPKMEYEYDYDYNCNKEKNKLELALQNLLSMYSRDDFVGISKMLNIGSEALKIELPMNRYEDGMQYLPNNNKCSIVRVHVNANTEWCVDTLLITTTYIIDEKNLMDLIIKRWVGLSFDIKSIVKNNEKNDKNESFNENFKYIHIKVGEKSWNSLLKRCKNYGILVRDGFGLAVESFLKKKDKL